ncbi:hypothetical protein SAMN06265375_101887 [Muriicola jejuensis]|uniref:DUF1643 domain-containing protein n=1 Tax=Muriicola jejuensis TaxID=504488 RepID=A0A6P0U8L1_9FLAO|nr:DUF1643 domain-containing protein [Muriicola jejuensis]NER09601.1 DUF1643 domain-containing protein [Muriicola jejuensis]SMP07491.1 hypothetical protein SAMN06265375_101887 [Muriicola jejuensis]
MAFLHLPNITATAEFSACRKYRYCLNLVLTSRAMGKTVCVIMQNPSVADEKVADKSVQFLEKLVFEKGLPEFSGVNRCVVVNQFARVQTKGFEGNKTDIGHENNRHLKAAIRIADTILIAWGKRNPFEDRQSTILKLLKKTEGKKILKTRKHPSRGFYRDFILPFPI